MQECVVNVPALSKNARVIAEAYGGRIRRNRARAIPRIGEGSEKEGARPGETVDGFVICEVRVVRGDHHVAPERAVVMDVKIALILGGWIEVSRGSANPGLQMPASLIKLFEGDHVRMR